MRPERTQLSVPASSWRMIEKAVGLDANVAFLDLEDAVAPAEKASARGNVVRAFTSLDWGQKPRAYRVNALDTPFFYRDLIDVIEGTGPGIDFVILPKANRPEDIHVVATLLNQLELALGLERSIGIEVQIESAEGLLNAAAIAKASRRVEALIFGPGDFAASVGMPMTAIGTEDAWDAAYGGDRWHYAMSSLVVAARAVGIAVIDGPMADFRDTEGLARSARRARALGFDGKWCIHPAQIPVVNEAFTPSVEEIAWARRLVQAYQAAVAGGSGATTVDGVMIDQASIAIAQRLLAASIGTFGESTPIDDS